MKISRLCFLYGRNMPTEKTFKALLIRILEKERRIRRESEHEWEANFFDLERFSRKKCCKLFRFGKSDLGKVRILLGIPDEVTAKDFDRVPGTEALCILLRRFAYPARWLELRRNFGRSQGSLSRIFYKTLHHIDGKYRHLLCSWN